jgi:hypothetical protein
MSSEDNDLLSESVSQRVASQLKLECETTLQFDKAIRIGIALSALAIAIYNLPAADSFGDIVLGIGALCVYIRATMGSPLVRRLTPDSIARVRRWMSEETSTSSEEESHNESDAT